MIRRSFLSVLSSLPLLGWAKPKAVEEEAIQLWQHQTDVIYEWRNWTGKYEPTSHEALQRLINAAIAKTSRRPPRVS